MNYAEFARLARKNTKTNSTTFTDQELVDFVNFHIEANAPEIVRADEQAFQMVAKRNLEEGIRQYELPTDLAKRIMRVEVYHQGGWHIGEEIDVNVVQRSLEDYDTTPVNFGAVPVWYTLFRNCINLYTASDIEDVTNGLVLYYTVYPHKWSTSDLVSSVDISIDPTPASCGLPREFHNPLLHLVTRSYKEGKQVPVPLSLLEQQAEALFRQSLQTYRNTNRDRVIITDQPVEHGIY